MSDDWNLHDAVEDSVRENAGHLALAGTLMAHSQRQKQLQALEASRQHQAQIAKTEEERLEIEKQRLELERLKQQAEKDEKEAVRLLRVMMAEVGAEFDGLSSRGQIKGKPEGVRRDYAMAVLLGKVALVRSRSGSLSDLNDLKELSRLENVAHDLVAHYFEGRDPLQITRDKWREIDAWMQTVDQLENEVTEACGVVPDPTAVQLPSKADLAENHRQLEELLAQLPARLEAHVAQLPMDLAVDGRLFPELAELAQLEDLREGKPASRAMAFASRWRMTAPVKLPPEPPMIVTDEVQPELVVAVQAALAKLDEWQSREAAHEAELHALVASLEEGRLEDAEASVEKLGTVRFAGLDYGPVADLQALQNELAALATAKRGEATHSAHKIRARHPMAGPSSELMQLLQGHVTRAEREKRTALIATLVIVGLVVAVGKLAVDHLRAELRLAAEARVKVDAMRQQLSGAMQAMNQESLVNVSLTNEVWLAFVSVPAGTFTMGSPLSEEGRFNDEGQVKVTLSHSFWLAKTEVTQAQWEAVMGSNPSRFKGDNLPVEYVKWEDAQAFIIKLNQQRILPDDWKFALPTEAQWEYACRAGEKGPYSGGNLDELAWHGSNSGSRTHEVAQKKANVWGLCDMHGNVWEWCADRYDDAPLQGGTDPTGPSSGDRRVYRGGSWGSDTRYCRAAYRYGSEADYHSSNLGFRPAIVPSR